MISPADLAQKSTELSSLNDEFHWRQSTHLAYYAIYHQLMYFIEQHNITIQGTGGVHQKAIIAIKRYSEIGEELSFYIQKMKKLRVKADYYINQDFLQENSFIQQDLMQRCLDYLQRM